MYKCHIHGKLDIGWCDKCEEIISCDCSFLTTTKFKDLIINSNEGEKTITVYVDHCKNCGDIKLIGY